MWALTFTRIQINTFTADFQIPIDLCYASNRPSWWLLLRKRASFMAKPVPGLSRSCTGRSGRRKPEPEVAPRCIGASLRAAIRSGRRSRGSRWKRPACSGWFSSCRSRTSRTRWCRRTPGCRRSRWRRPTRRRSSWSAGPRTGRRKSRWRCSSRGRFYESW